jgi:hypothetical protein
MVAILLQVDKRISPGKTIPPAKPEACQALAPQSGLSLSAALKLAFTRVPGSGRKDLVFKNR